VPIEPSTDERIRQLEERVARLENPVRALGIAWPPQPSTTVPPVSSFEQALEAMKHGARMTRGGWNGAHTVSLCSPVDLVGEPMFTSAVFLIVTSRGERMPWLASQADLLAEDWAVV